MLGDYSSALTLAALAGITWLMLRRRTPPALAATVVWLVLYVFGYSFAVRYAIWGLPFFIMAGYLREAAALQLGLAVLVAVYAVGSRDEISQIELILRGAAPHGRLRRAGAGRVARLRGGVAAAYARDRQTARRAERRGGSGVGRISLLDDAGGKAPRLSGPPTAQRPSVIRRHAEG